MTGLDCRRRVVARWFRGGLAALLALTGTGVLALGAPSVAVAEPIGVTGLLPAAGALDGAYPDPQTSLSPSAQLQVGVAVAGAGEHDGNDVLLAAPTTVRISARNTGTNRYNASYRIVLDRQPTSALTASYRGVSVPVKGPYLVAGKSVYILENVSDLLKDVLTEVDLGVSFGGDPGTASVGVEVFSTDSPNTVPDFLTADAAPRHAGDYDGDATVYQRTLTPLNLVPLLVTTHIAAPEHEVVRGPDRWRYEATVTLQETSLGEATGVTVTDDIPAGLEYLGCDGLPDCGNPTVTTAVDADGTVVTRLVWTLPSLSAGSTTVLRYRVGALDKANTNQGPGVVDASNNSGPTTAENPGEQVAIDHTRAEATYVVGGVNTAVTSTDTERVTLEDLAIQKGGSTGTISPGGTTRWTVNMQVSSYTTAATGITLTDTIPDGLCPLGLSAAQGAVVGCPSTNDPATDPTRPFSAVALNADKTITLTWADVPAATTSVAYSTTTLATYRAGGPVLRKDAWTNAAHIQGTLTDADSAVGTRLVKDDSGAGQESPDIMLEKKWARPAPDGSCPGTASAVGAASWSASPQGDGFGPGDHVCWLLTIQRPDSNAVVTSQITLYDIMPRGHALVSSQDPDAGAGAGASLAPASAVGRTLTWTLGGDIAAPKRLVLRTRLGDPQAGTPEDIPDNLAKVAYTNTPGTPYQLRSSAMVGWREPRLAITKAATPATGAHGGDEISYTVTVANNGNADALDVSVRDLLPTRMRCASITPGSLPTGFSCTDPIAPATRPIIQGTLATVAASAHVDVTYKLKVPADAAPGETFDNEAGIREYYATTNQPTPNERFRYVPGNNIDPTTTGAGYPNVEPIGARTTVRVAVEPATVIKTNGTSITTGADPKNGDHDLTFGEDVDYTVKIVLPRDTTLPAGATVKDVLPSGLKPTGTPAGTPAVTSPLPLTGATAAVAGQTLTVTLPNAVAVGAVAEADRTITVTYRARLDAPTGTSLAAGSTRKNTATLTYTTLGGQTLSPQGSSTVTIVEPDVAIGLTVVNPANAQVTPGSTLNVTLTAGNAANASTAYDPVYTLVLPATLIPPNSWPAGVSYDAGSRTVSWSPGDLPGGGTATVSFALSAPNPLVIGTTYDWKGTLDASSAPGSSAGTAERVGSTTYPNTRYHETKTVSLTAPALGITKTMTGTGTIGSELSATVTATAPAGSVVHDLVLVDQLPNGLAYGATSASDCAGSPLPAPTYDATRRILQWWGGEAFAAGDTGVSRTCSVTYTVVPQASSGAAVDGARLTNAAFAAGDTTARRASAPAVGDPLTSYRSSFDTSVTADASATIQEPRMTLTKANDHGSSPVHGGDVVIFTLTVGNTGTSAGYDTRLVDTLPAGLAPQTTPVVATRAGGGTFTGTWDATARTITWDVGTVPPGASWQLTYPTVVDASIPAGTSLVNSARVTTTSLAGAIAGERTAPYTRYTASDTSSLGAAGLSVSKAVTPAVAAVGQSVTYTITVSIPANLSAQDVTLRDVLPKGFGFSSGSLACPSSVGCTGATTTTTTAGDGTVTATTTVGAVPGAPTARTITWTLQGYAAALPGTTVPNTATASWCQSAGCAIPSQAASDPVTFAVRAPAVTLAKTRVGGRDDAGVRHVVTGDDLTYTVTLTNSGPVPAYDAVVTDVADEGLAWSTTQPSDGSTPTSTAGPDGNGKVVRTFTVPVVPANGTATVRYRLTVGAFSAAQKRPGAEDDLVNEASVTTWASGPASWTHRATAGPSASVGTGVEVDQAAAVSGVVWLDRNGDRIRQADEPTVPGAIVSLSDGSGPLTATTGADGGWSRSGLPPTTYVTLTVTNPPAGTTVGPPTVAMPLALPDGGSVTGVDIPLRPSLTLGDLVWFDGNGNGVQDPGEPGVSGARVRVTWLGLDGIPSADDLLLGDVVTDAAGAYRVEGLPGGKYAVALDPTSIPAGYRSAVATLALTLTASRDDADFPLTLIPAEPPAAELGDLVWVDRDGDGRPGPGEGVAGVVLLVTGPGADGLAGTADDVRHHVRTDADGRWSSGPLPTGDYVITLDPSTTGGPVPVADLDGGDPAVTSVHLDAATGQVGVGGEHRAPTDVDFRLADAASVTGALWVDDNKNMVRDPGERPLAGVTVTLHWTSPTGETAQWQVVTGPDGSYAKHGLPPGVYLISYEPAKLPTGKTSLAARDSLSPSRIGITLNPRQQRSQLDFTAITAATPRPTSPHAQTPLPSPWVPGGSPGTGGSGFPRGSSGAPRPGGAAGAGPGASGSELPWTGSSVNQALALGLTVLALGSVLLAGARRARTAPVRARRTVRERPDLPR